jgi:hypothetical protein
MRPTLLILLLTATLTVHPQRNDTLRIDTADGTLTILKDQHPLLSYVYKTLYPPPGVDTAYKKSGFIHPLYAPTARFSPASSPPITTTISASGIPGHISYTKATPSTAGTSLPAKAPNASQSSYLQGQVQMSRALKSFSNTSHCTRTARRKYLWTRFSS